MNTDVTLEKLVSSIKRRPAMYYEKENIRELRRFLVGFSLGSRFGSSRDEKIIDFDQEFQRFVSEKLRVTNMEVGWDITLQNEARCRGVNADDLVLGFLDEFFSRK